MLPHHLVNMTPEEERELRALVTRHYARNDLPIQITQTNSGFTATRLEITGCGRSERDALDDLSTKELDALIASAPRKKKQ